MRVISGLCRGLKLNSLDGMDTRPTLDRVKEALFSMLFDRCQDAEGLDLFAGSGALGIELLSRYAKRCTFVDASPDAINIVKQNIAKAHLSDKADIKLGDALTFVNSANGKYDIIFLDPPYKSGLYDELLSVISKRQLLNDGGVVVCECSTDTVLETGGYTVLRDKTYGKVRLCVLELV